MALACLQFGGFCHYRRRRHPAAGQRVGRPSVAGEKRKGRVVGMVRSLLVLALVGATSLVLAGCSGVAGQRGLAKKPPPDEFQVPTRQPLPLPPNYQLRPPQPGAPPLEAAVPLQAKQSVFGKEAMQAAATPATLPGFERRSAGEQAL